MLLYLKIGSFKDISLPKFSENASMSVPSAWNLKNMVEEYINSDDLLDETDLKKPNRSSFTGIEFYIPIFKLYCK